MKSTIPQTGNKKITRDHLAAQTAIIEKVDASYVRKIIRGGYEPTTKAGKQKAKSIISTYNKLKLGTEALVKKIRQVKRA